MDCLSTITETVEHIIETICGTGTGVTRNQLPDICELNENVYQFYSPENGSPNVEIVFFHGIHPGDAISSKAYVETWTSFHGSTSNCWPQTWLAENFPRARILAVSYDSSAKKGRRQGRLDLYLTAENLIQDLMDGRGNVAAHEGCPIVLVGKDLGGLIIKAICLEAKKKGMTSFLRNMKGILYYATPHHGLQNFPSQFNGAVAQLLGWGNVDIVRLNSDFSLLRKQNKWEARAIIAARPGTQPRLDVPEAAARFDVDQFYTVGVDIDNICKPPRATSKSYTYLADLVSDCIVSFNNESQSATEKGTKLTSSLLFEDDDYYVPMERSRDEVRTALKSLNKRIVVLHGGPGSGKSSLARHLALMFRDEDLGVASSSSQDFFFTDGVIYLTCGSEADVVSKLRELLQSFGVKLPVEDELSPDMVGLRTHLALHLKDLQALVILDDVWKADLVEKLVVPGRVKYLVTTQVVTLLKSNSKAVGVPIQDIAQEDARKILGNYMGFPGGLIPAELLGQADDIIKATESHPLALATLGLVMDSEQKYCVHEWEELKDNLLNRLKLEDHVIIFGEQYPKTVYAALTFAVELLDDAAMNLLYKMVLFQGPFIPEPIVRLFLQCTQPVSNWEALFSTRKRLESLGLVRTDKYILFPHFMGEKRKALAIHGLRQQFILGAMEDNNNASSITKFLVEDPSSVNLHLGLGSDCELATALCALYGCSVIKERALTKMGSKFLWSGFRSEDNMVKIFGWLVHVMSLGYEGGSNSQSQISRAASQVFWMLFNKGQLDDANIACLLDWAETVRSTCRFLFFLSVIFHKTTYEFCVTDIPCTTDKLMVLLSIHAQKALQLAAADAITVFTCSSRNWRLMASSPKMLKLLVGLLAQDVDESIQLQAVRSLSHLTGSRDNQVLTNLLATPELLERLCKLLSKDFGETYDLAVTAITNLAVVCQNQDLIAIAQFPSSLERLVGVLDQEVVDQRTKQDALRTLVNIALCVENRVSMLAVPGLLDRLLLLQCEEDQKLCYGAAGVIRCLTCSLENRVSLGQNPGVIGGLIRLLSEDVDESIQLLAVDALANLTHLKDNQVPTNLLATPELLERLVQLLSKDMGETCMRAVTVIKNLAFASQNLVVIGQFPSLLEKLAGLLAQDVDRGIQKETLWALMLLGESDKNSVLAIPGLLDRLVVLLYELDLRYGTVGVIRHLACTIENRFSLAQNPGVIRGLLRLLSQDVDESIQLVAADSLAVLTHLQDNQVLTNLLATPELLERLFRLLSREMGGKYVRAVTAIKNLAFTSENQVIIAQFPSSLEKLAGLLAQGVDRDTQREALCVLLLLVQSDKNQISILAIPGLLDRLVVLLYEGHLWRGAAAVIGHLACKIENRVSLAQNPGVIGGFIRLLSQDMDEYIQLMAVESLALLTHLQDNQVLTNLLATPELLERLCKLLSKDLRLPLKNLFNFRAATAIKNLAFTSDNQVAIAQFPSCLERLAALLAQDVDRDTQKEALWTLMLLAQSDKNQVSILAIPGLLDRLVDLLYEVELCFGAASVIRYLACSTENRVSLVQNAGVHLGLMRLLSEDFDERIQEAAANGIVILLQGYIAILQDAGAMERLLSLDERYSNIFSTITSGYARAKYLISNRYWQQSYEKVSLKEYSAALMYITKALELCGENDFLWQERGVIRRLSGDFPGALADLNRALQLAPDDYEVLKHRSLVKYMMEDEEGARADAERAIQVRPSRVDEDSYGQGCLGVLSVQFLNYELK